MVRDSVTEGRVSSLLTEAHDDRGDTDGPELLSQHPRGNGHREDIGPRFDE
jgi:hypothetical protein